MGGFGDCMGKGANPSRYNFAIGSAAAAVLSDGGLGGPIESVPAFLTDLYLQKRALREARLPTDVLNIAKNILYVDTGSDKILFDTGIGASQGGTLLEELEAANVMPSEITKIMITHAHPDHIGGILTNVTNGDFIYPNAEVRHPCSQCACRRVCLLQPALPALLGCMSLCAAARLLKRWLFA